MANVLSGIGNLPSGIGHLSPGGYSLPTNLKLPPAAYNFLAGLPLAANAGYTSESRAAARPRAQSNAYAPFDATGSLMQTFGTGVLSCNPMSVFDLMNLGGGPLAGSGMPGHTAATPGASMSPPTGPAVSAAYAAGAPLPRSGGKGVMG
ncbi:MAG TPA: hypothetical protein VGY99_32805 [Candidatus Binataceae bacterium]|jgi:hypothetical protein|nr:hypothetical protein [Candidatus Binataceae bacterium]